MLRWRTIRLVILVALLASFARAVATHASHLGPAEWVVSAALVLVLALALVPVPRKPA
jgi:hypothetical protein